MPTSSATQPAARPSKLRFILTALFAACIMVFLPLGIYQDPADPSGPAWIYGIAGALLTVSAWQNWPLLWNTMGRYFRGSFGEYATRWYFGVLGALLALVALAGSLA
jgi:hypothetical protein